MSNVTEKKPLLIQIAGEITPNVLPVTASAVGYDFVQGNYIYYSTGSDSWITAPEMDPIYWQSDTAGSIFTTGSISISGSNPDAVLELEAPVSKILAPSGSLVLSSSTGIYVSGSFFASGVISATLGLSGSLTKLTDGTSYIIAGSGVTVASSSNGAITISATGGSGLATGKQHVAGASTSATTSPLMIGQFAWVPADYTGLTSVRVRAIMATDGTANHTGSLQIYNLTSGSYLDLVDTPSSGKHFTITGSTSTLVSSSNLLTGITNFNNSSTSVYEVRVSGSTANNIIVGGVELIFN